MIQCATPGCTRCVLPEPCIYILEYLAVSVRIRQISSTSHHSTLYLLTSKLILNDYPDYGLRVYGLLLVPKLNGFVCLPRGYIDVCFRVLLVIPKWSGTTLKALILGSPVPMNTFTEELQNEPILDPCLYFNS